MTTAQARRIILVRSRQVRRNGDLEPPLVTAGDDAAQVHRFLKPGRDSYCADDVLDALLCAR